jgi:hypothetical protein
MIDKLKEYVGVLKGIAWVLSTVVIGIGMGWAYGETLAQEAGREAAQAEIQPWTAKFEMDFKRNQREEDRQLWRDCLDYEYPDLTDEARRRRCDDEMEWRADVYYPWEETCINIKAHAMAADSMAVCPEEPEYKPEGGP